MYVGMYVCMYVCIYEKWSQKQTTHSLSTHLMCGIYVGLPNGPVFLCDNAGSTCDSQADK